MGTHTDTNANTDANTDANGSAQLGGPKLNASNLVFEAESSVRF